ncbi:P2X receptor A [Symbiodinium microadriaticum]|uniref:p2X receptor A n=2 Tax=Symbiodinium TaxID=2949 RepID=A0A1Q9D9P7_SYMMI|nr:P2X receptor A [Symbiodinium microadriaticum]
MASCRWCQCCRIPDTCCGVDLHNLFAYSTTKYIVIRDARLGLLHYTLMFFIVVYILVYQLIGNLGYLKFNDAQNTVRLTLQEPTAGCNPNDTGCKDSFTPLSHLPYCCAQNSSCKTNDDGSCSCDYRPAFKDYNCTWMSGTSAAAIRESSIVVSTFTHEYTMTLNTSCFTSYPAAAESCDELYIVQEKAQVFTADVESFTLLIDHSVTSPKSGLATTSRDMQGLLFVGPNGNDGSEATALKDGLCSSAADAVDAPRNGRTTNKAPCYLKPSSAGGLDFFAVGTLLQATGVSLESESYPGSGHSTRYEGITINLNIDYSNSVPWHGLQANISYLYKPSVIPRSTFKTTEVSPLSPDGLHMLKKSLHGLLFEVRAGGQLATFDFTQLLLQLTTSLTLLALATVGVNIMAQYVLRYRHYYSEALYDRTADFDNISFWARRRAGLMEYGYRPNATPSLSFRSERAALASAPVMEFAFSSEVQIISIFCYPHLFPISWLNRKGWVEFSSNSALLLPVMQSGVDSEASTCSTDSVSEEDSLKVQLDRERRKSAEKDEQIRILQIRVKALEMELVRMKSEKVSGETSGFAKVQQELLDELQKRKAVQYELICTGQQVCELQEKLNEQEKMIREMAGPAKSSPPMSSRTTSKHSTTSATSPVNTPRTPHGASFKVAAQRKAVEPSFQPLPPAATVPEVAPGFATPRSAGPVPAASGSPLSPASSGYIATSPSVAVPSSPALTARSVTFTPRSRAASHTTLDGTYAPRVPRVGTEMVRMSSFTNGLSPEQRSRGSFGKPSATNIRVIMPATSPAALTPWWMPVGHAATICAPPGSYRENTAN